jgi:hypothetical protein
MIPILLKFPGSDVNERDRSGHTLLHIAAKWKDIRMVKQLLRSGANPFSIDHNGHTPGMECRDSVECTKFLQLFEDRVMDSLRVRGLVERRVAILSALHPRLGKDALIRSLVPDVFRQLVEDAGDALAGDSPAFTPEQLDSMSLELAENVKAAMDLVDHEEALQQ